MIKGEVRLVFRDIATGEITKEHTEKNVITETMLNRMADSNLNYSHAYGRFGDNIMIGGHEQPTDRWNYRIFDVYEFGYTESGVTSPRWLSGNVGTGSTFAYYHEYQQRFNPPSSDRDIYVIAVTWKDYNSLRSYNQPNDAAAYLALDTPCTQTSTETLDVFYRIIFDNPDPATSGLNNSKMYQIASRAIAANGPNAIYYPNYNLFYYSLSKALPFTDGEWLGDGYTGIGSADLGSFYGNQTYAGGSSDGNTTYRARRLTFSCSLTQLVGRVVGGVGHLRADTTEERWTQFHNPLLTSNDSPVQNIFIHSAAATGPFYKSTEVGSSTGTVVVDGSGWTNPDWNKMLHIEITSTGAIGAAEYKFHFGNCTGYKNNTYEPSAIGIACCNNSNSFGGVGWFSQSGADMSLYNGLLAMEYGTHPTRMANFRADTFGWTDVITCERHRFYAADTTAYDGTEVNQICVIPGRSNIGSFVENDMWVADEGGLYRVHADASLVEKFDNTHTDLTGLASGACRGVTYTPGRIWAAFDGGLAYTTDNGTTFTIYDAGTSPAFTAAEYARIWFIQGDPSHADHRLAVAYNTESTASNRADFDIYWWDSVGGFGNTASNMYYGSTGSYPRRRHETFRIFSCSPNDGVWGCRSYNAQSDQVAMFNYNATSHTHVYPAYGSANDRNRYYLNWTQDLTGADAIHVFYYNNNDSRFAICKQDGTQIISDRFYRDDVPLGVYRNWLSEGSGSAATKCILASGMLVGSTLRNGSSGEVKQWYMIPAWNDNNHPLGGEGYHVLWKGYGWDGASWVEGNTGSKVTHAGAEALVDGLTLAFDDDGGSQQFVATDHFNGGIIDGILVDAATTFSHEYNLYYKPVKYDLTDVEGGGLLPATQRTIPYGVPEADRGLSIDNSGYTITGGGDYLDASADNWRGRLNHTMDDYAYFRFRLDTGSSINGDYTIGLCDASKAGTTVEHNNIDYAFRISAGVLGGTDSFRVEIVSNGTDLATITDGSAGLRDTGRGVYNRSNEDYIYLKLRRDAGETDLKLTFREQVVYTFTGVTGNLMPAFILSGSTSSSNNMRVDSIGKSLTDYIIDLGNSSLSTGRFDPNFWIVDYTTAGRPAADAIKINGVPVTTVHLNKYTTPLAAGEVDFLHNGYIRYSAADVGKTLTIDRYNIILHE